MVDNVTQTDSLNLLNVIHLEWESLKLQDLSKGTSENEGLLDRLGVLHSWLQNKDVKAKKKGIEPLNIFDQQLLSLCYFNRYFQWMGES